MEYEEFKNIRIKEHFRIIAFKIPKQPPDMNFRNFKVGFSTVLLDSRISLSMKIPKLIES